MTIKKMKVFICGYARTGKDTLCNHIIEGNGYNWIVLSKKYKEINLDHKFKRFAFADYLKQEVYQMYGICPDVKQKDSKIFITSEGVFSARDLWIKVAAERRLEDVNYFSKRLPTEGNHIITDWRYPDELEYHEGRSEIITIRVFRKDVEISDSISEHSLDNIETDYLFLDDISSLEKCIELLPQYKDYEQICVV